MPPSRPRLDASSPAPLTRWRVTRKEPTMTRSPHHSVLRKIAARRTRVEGTAAPAARTTFWTGSAPQPGKQARIAALGGPRRLTQRELEVLELVARGETDQRIADQLYV